MQTAKFTVRVEFASGNKDYLRNEDNKPKHYPTRHAAHEAGAFLMDYPGSPVVDYAVRPA